MIFDVLKVALICVEVVLIFNLMILVHEWGHFLAARWRGLVVEKFAIWFGKPIWKKTIGGVEYRLGSIPAGGYVAIPQLAPMEIMEGEVDTDRSQLPPVKPIDKIIVAFAGPLFSFLLAVFFACIVWVIGRPVGEAELNTTIGFVVPDGPAAQAGLLPGDQILEVNGVPVSQFSPAGNARSSIVWNVARSEAPVIPVKVDRAGEIFTVDVEPKTPVRAGWGRRNLRRIDIMPAMTPKIARVLPNTPEAAAGFQSGDLITSANGEKLLSLIQLAEILDASGGQPVPVTIERNGASINALLTPPPARVAVAIKDGPAATAGLEKGDLILSANGDPLINRTDLGKILTAAAGQPVTLAIQRGNETRDVTLVPEIPEGDNDYRIGIVWSQGGIEWDPDGQLGRIHPSPIQQVTAGVTTMYDTLAAVLSPKSEIKAQHLSGPVGIMNAYYLLFQRQDGWLLALWFSVVLNINLALLNLLPIPVLDGGHIVLATIEGIFRRPVNIRVLEVIQNGFALLLIGFMLYVTFFDVLDLPRSLKGESVESTMRFKTGTKPESPAP